MEIKSGATVASDWFGNMEKWRKLAGEAAAPGVLVYGGDETQDRTQAKVVPWRAISRVYQE